MEAPPPVEMKVILSARSNWFTAATESPPPMMVSASSLAATALATARVPASKEGISKTPMGPFQKTLLAMPMASAYSSAVSGPISRPIMSSGISSTETVARLASLAKASAHTTSTGSSSDTPRSAAFFIISPARSTQSASMSEVPTDLPWAARKVKHMPPPMMRVSAFSSSASMTLILSETFEPPRMATKGRRGSSSMPVSVATSRSMR